MATEIIMPQLGLTMTTGTVSQWLKSNGDEVKKGDEIVEVETDKISNIVEAHADGVLQIVMQEGEEGPVKSVMGYICTTGEKINSISSFGVNVAVPAAPIATSTPLVKVNIPIADRQKSIIVIGAGPGGYITAIKAAQMGAKVTIIEKKYLGGTCLNVGCIPTKALIHVASAVELMKNKTTVLGIKVSGIDVDWTKVQQYKGGIVKTLVNGVKGLLKSNGITIMMGEGKIVDAHTVEVNDQQLTADNIILAVGSEPVMIPIPGKDLPGIIDSTGALLLDPLPKSMVIIGGGVIGIEFASLYTSMGMKCTIIEALPKILPPIDAEITAILKKDLEARGIEIWTDAPVQSIEQDGNGCKVFMKHNGEIKSVTGEKVLMCVGRRASIKGIGLEETGVELNRGKVVTDDNFQTNIPSISAIGDCNGKLMLAHVASAQGVAVVEYIMTGKHSYHPETVPSCIFIEPECASVGAQEETLKEKGIDYKVGKFQMVGNGKSLIESEGVGIIKILADAKYGQILGFHMYGPRASDIIATAAIAIRLEATTDELTSTIFAHPTVGEAIGEAALDVFGIPLSWPSKK
ncbi:dihydrolipoyl dehydrogenase [Megasphaera sueciensis]|uniref:dihydrolipoyl dehydrogenase n=1 Tax=Megasphaera sueciensis TaxID=349094 RepID=UPI003CFECBCB